MKQLINLLLNAEDADIMEQKATLGNKIKLLGVDAENAENENIMEIINKNSINQSIYNSNNLNYNNNQ